MRHGWILFAALAAAACRQPVAPPAENKAERLMSGCAETERLLGQMKAAEASFSYDTSGNGAVSEALWGALPENMRSALMQAIAYQAVCASGELREQPVTIRSSETSEILAQETVADFAR